MLTKFNSNINDIVNNKSNTFLKHFLKFENSVIVFTCLKSKIQFLSEPENLPVSIRGIYAFS